MKSKKIVFIALLTVGLFSCKQEKILELPLTAQIGYGQFKSGLGGISPISESENAIYRILGVNTNKSTLVLEETGLSKSQLHSSQTGYKAHSFQGEEFTTKSTISLEQFNGKYVLLDFWATWCGPCIREFPNLRELYAKADTAKFVIIGIVGDSQPVTLTNAIEKHEIAWPQILSDDTNKIKEKYGITGYPTTFLINTEGIIIAKNLRGKELEEKF